MLYSDDLTLYENFRKSNLLNDDDNDENDFIDDLNYYQTNQTFENSYNTIFHFNEEDEVLDDFYNNNNKNYFTEKEIIVESKKTKKEKIFAIKKVQKRGRLRKNCSKIGKGKHNNKCVDNASKAIINESTRASICPFFKRKAIKYARKNGLKICDSNLASFKSNKYLVQGYNKINFFLDKSIKELFYYVNTKSGLDNKRKIEYLLSHEMNNDSVKVKKLNLLFNASYGGYLKSILNDSKYIKINGYEFYLEKSFKTLKDFYNTGNKVFTQYEKQLYKENILKIINREKITRKIRKK